MATRFLKIDYTARVKDGKIFDTTHKEEAQKAGIYDEHHVYRPLPVIVGQKQVPDGVDEALAEIPSGETRTINVPPEKAFGERNPALIRLIPLKLFKERKINPVPGLPIEVDRMQGRVQTVSGGRVRVDFNHELAGKELVYDVTVKAEAKSDHEKADFLVERSFNEAKDLSFTYEKGKLTVTLTPAIARDRNILARKANLAAESFLYLTAKTVTFTENWENPEEKKADEKAETKE
ncbi:Putative FKBP-type peptidyl-prolyl cis-trans isomerase [uncultured archaeon]|nr:Putative FKBP-type peptidyl-prolyl cis-trans isomerase [uncultured archaeon]